MEKITSVYLKDQVKLYFNKLSVWKIVWWFRKYQAFENQIKFLRALTVWKDFPKNCSFHGSTGLLPR